MARRRRARSIGKPSTGGAQAPDGFASPRASINPPDLTPRRRRHVGKRLKMPKATKPSAVRRGYF